MIRVAIVEDEMLVRLGLRMCLESSPDIYVAGAFASAEEAEAGQDKAPVDVLLTDIRSIAIAGLLRQGEGSFLLLVECEPEADQQTVFTRLSAHLKPTVLPVDVAPLEGELPECARVIYRKL